MAVRVLVVDDDATVRWLIARLFATCPDLNVVGEAADGESAVSAALVTNPDVIVLDHLMPRGSGLAVIPQLLDAAPGTRVVMFTARHRAELEHSAMPAGADTVLAKSGDLSELLAAVRAAGTRRGHPTRGDVAI